MSAAQLLTLASCLQAAKPVADVECAVARRARHQLPLCAT